MNIAGIEVAWVVMLAPGLAASVYVLVDALRDRRALRASKTNGVAQMVAVLSVRSEVLRLIQQVLLIGIGVGSWFVGPPAHPDTSLFASVVLVVLFAMGFLLAANSVLNAVARRKVLNYLGRG